MNRRPLRPGLLFLVVSGLAGALLWTFLFPVVEPISPIAHLQIDWVFFRPLWNAWDGRLAKGWFAAEAVVAILAGLWAAWVFGEHRFGQARTEERDGPTQ